MDGRRVIATILVGLLAFQSAARQAERIWRPAHVHGVVAAMPMSTFEAHPEAPAHYPLAHLRPQAHPHRHSHAELGRHRHAADVTDMVLVEADDNDSATAALAGKADGFVLATAPWRSPPATPVPTRWNAMSASSHGLGALEPPDPPPRPLRASSCQA